VDACPGDISEEVVRFDVLRAVRIDVGNQRAEVRGCGGQTSG
jgi:hypothetical protein